MSSSSFITITINIIRTLRHAIFTRVPSELLSIISLLIILFSGTLFHYASLLSYLLKLLLVVWLEVLVLALIVRLAKDLLHFGIKLLWIELLV